MAGLQLHTYVEAMLGRWGLYQRWLRRGGSLPGPKRVTSWYGKMILDPHVQEQNKGAVIVPSLPCPVDADEAQETTQCVAVLIQDQRNILVELYVWRSRPVDIYKAMHCCEKTYYNRLYAAYTDLLGYFNDVAAGVPLPAIDSVNHEDEVVFVKYA